MWRDSALDILIHDFILPCKPEHFFSTMVEIHCLLQKEWQLMDIIRWCCGEREFSDWRVNGLIRRYIQQSAASTMCTLLICYLFVLCLWKQIFVETACSGLRSRLIISIRTTKYFIKMLYKNIGCLWPVLKVYQQKWRYATVMAILGARVYMGVWGLCPSEVRGQL